MSIELIYFITICNSVLYQEFYIYCDFVFNKFVQYDCMTDNCFFYVKVIIIIISYIIINVGITYFLKFINSNNNSLFTSIKKKVKKKK